MRSNTPAQTTLECLLGMLYIYIILLFSFVYLEHHGELATEYYAVKLHT